MKRTTVLFSTLSMLLIILSLQGCINVEQKMVIKEDSSGTVSLHYWTKSSYIDMGGGVAMGDDIGGYNFMKEGIKQKYNTDVSNITSLNMYTESDDSTTHAKVDIAFKNINTLSQALGFQKSQVSYVKGKDGMDFRFIIPHDTAFRKQYITDEHKYIFTFEFPNEVLSTSAYGTKNGKTAVFTIPVMDIANKDIELTATVKSKFNPCGLFGIELPAVLLFGLAFFSLKKLKKKKKYEK